MASNVSEHRIDALIVGAGFGGIYQLRSLLQLGLSAKVIDLAADVGGTWFWNRYPGAMSDTESYVYRYSWDKEDLQTYPWTHHYVKQPDVLAYLEHIVKRHDLRKYISLKTEMQSATWDASEKLWEVQVNTGIVFKVKYLITALGLLSRPNYPDIPGINTFKGTLCHTAAWKSDIELRDKRVGVIGCGSTGVQVITEIAKDVKALVCFQRHPQYSVPSGDGPVPPEYREHVNANYDKIMAQVRNSAFGFGFGESERTYDSYPPEEREELFEKVWNQGNGFRFMSGAFSDVSLTGDQPPRCLKFQEFHELETNYCCNRSPRIRSQTKQPVNLFGKRSERLSKTLKRLGSCNPMITMLAGHFVMADITSSLIATTSLLSI